MTSLRVTFCLLWPVIMIINFLASRNQISDSLTAYKLWENLNTIVLESVSIIIKNYLHLKIHLYVHNVLTTCNFYFHLICMYTCNLVCYSIKILKCINIYIKRFFLQNACMTSSYNDAFAVSLRCHTKRILLYIVLYFHCHYMQF